MRCAPNEPNARFEEAASDSTIFVVSLQGVPGVDHRNNGRLDKFKEKWAAKCGPASLQGIHHCPGVHDPRRGYGVTTSFLFCLERAKEMNLNVSIFLEDDARLFDRATAFCDLDRRKELWTHLPHDTFLAFLGGHTWVYPEDEEDETNFKSGAKEFKESSLSFGTYGYAVPRQSMDHLTNAIKEDIIRGFIDEKGVYHRDFLSPERSWYRIAQSINRKIYVIDPLVVMHEGGFSNTWGRQRGDITGEEEDGGMVIGPRGIN